MDADRIRSLLSSTDPEIISGTSSVAGFFKSLQGRSFTAYGDGSYDIFALVTKPKEKHRFPFLEKFVCTKTGALNNVTDNVWQIIKQDFKSLVWVAQKEDPNKTWFFERADGSYTWGDRTLFWYGVSDMHSMSDFIQAFVKADQANTTGERKNTSSNVASAIKGKPASGTRPYSTMSSVGLKLWSSKRAFHQSSLASDKRVGIIGARGYTGQELIKLLDSHPGLDLACVSSRELVGKHCQEYTSKKVLYSSLSPADVAKTKDVDCWVLALPNGVCKPFSDAIQASGKAKVVVDLSADYRFTFDWQYGLPELYDNRNKISRLASLGKLVKISNPGCYATGSQLGIAPLVSKSLVSGLPTIFGVSGYSGAGTKPSPKNDPENLKDNIIPYALTDHTHEKEISYQSGVQVAFSPHVGQFFQGISLTISIPLTRTMDAAEIHELYSSFYGGESLVKVTRDIPEVKWAAGKHHVTVGGFKVHSSGKRVVLVATIDNLLKGAATQALQVCVVYHHLAFKHLTY